MSCGEKREEREQNSYTPRETPPSAEYPGSKENDSIWKHKADSIDHKVKEK
jgi:hypothetical protein